MQARGRRRRTGEVRACGMQVVPRLFGNGPCCCKMPVNSHGRHPMRSVLPAQAALQAALSYGGNRVLRFPAGRFLLSKPIYANVSGLVIKGAGVNRTTLVFTRSLSDVYGMQYGVDSCTGGWGGSMRVLAMRARFRLRPATLVALLRGKWPPLCHPSIPCRRAQSAVVFRRRHGRAEVRCGGDACASLLRYHHTESQQLSEAAAGVAAAAWTGRAAGRGRQALALPHPPRSSLLRRLTCPQTPPAARATGRGPASHQLLRRSHAATPPPPCHAPPAAGTARTTGAGEAGGIYGDHAWINGAQGG